MRHVAVFDPSDAIADPDWRSCIGAIIQVERHVLTQNAKTGLWDRATHTACYLSSAPVPNRERKRLFAHIIEDVTLVKLPDVGTTRIHVRFKGGETETLTTKNAKSSAQQVKTEPQVIELVDALLKTNTYPEIAAILNERQVRPGGSVRRGQAAAQFTALRSLIAKEYKLRPRYDRLRARGMLSRPEAAERLGISECTLVRWADHGLIQRHAYNAHAHLYELPENNLPVKHSSRWDRLADRAAASSQAPD